LRYRIIRQKRQRKEQKSSSDDDESDFIQAAMFGLQVGSMISGARGKARASRAQLQANQAAIGDINKALGGLEETALARQETAEEETNVAFEESARQSSTMFDDLQKSTEDASGKQGFAFSGEVSENFEVMQKRMQDQFGVTKENLDRNLEKTVASIEEWKLGETERLSAEKRKLEYQNQTLGATSSTWGALFG
tara:strand:+ start:1201 stop:1782 length:582 start_codon:yes stop_codon:yes gene_type:complete